MTHQRIKIPEFAAATLWLAAALSGSPGCAKVAAHLRGEQGLLAHCHHEQPAPQIVTVGGKVQEPRQIEIGNGGLTVQRALMLAGGARELAQATTNTAAGQELIAKRELLVKLNNLTTLGRTIGKFEFYEEVWDLKPVLAKDFVPATREEVESTLAEKRASADAVIEALSALFQTQSFVGSPQALLDQSVAVAILEEQLRMFDISPEYFEGAPRSDSEKKLGDAIRNEASAMELIAEARGGQAWAQSHRTEFLVALDRRSAQPPVTYYFPYETVVGGFAGDIALVDGDAVDVVDVKDTELNPQAAVATGEPTAVAIDGYVKSPAIQEGLATIGSVHAQTQRTINDPRSVWMLVRPAPSGKAARVFVLTDRLVGLNGAAAGAPTHDGDAFTYLILPQVPIVLDSLVLRYLGTADRQCLNRLHNALQQHRDSLQARREAVHERRAATRGAGSAHPTILR